MTTDHSQHSSLREKLVEHLVLGEILKAACHLTVVSGQLGMEKNDFLRQVIEYEYPNYEWEKENFRLRPGKETLVREILGELSGSEG